MASIPQAAIRLPAALNLKGKAMMSDAYHDGIDADTVLRYKDIIEDCIPHKKWETAIDLCRVGRNKVGSKYKRYFDGFIKQLKMAKAELSLKDGE